MTADPVEVSATAEPGAEEKAAAAAARADARAKRIAAAVERSKAEYQAEHAYTERDWYLAADVAGPSKVDRQRVEYACTARLAIPGQHNSAQRALDDILTCVGTKPLKSLPRELVATGARAAIGTGEKTKAAEFARAAKSNWRVSVGTAMVSSEALEFADEITEATHPLLAVTSQGIHYPVLVSLVRLLSSIRNEQTAALASILEPLAASREWAFSRPLFSENTDRLRAPGAPVGADILRSTFGDIDRKELAIFLGAEKNVLEAALNRIGRAFGGGEEEPEVPEGERVERGVREL